jgi:YVTN family beta-propeller protein
VDPTHHRLYVSRETRVQVLDARTGRLDGEIPNTAGVHGIAIAPDLGYGFTSNGKSNSVTVFNLADLKVIGDIKISGAGPDAILYEPRLYEPRLKRVYTFNAHSNTATVIDAATRKELQTIALPGKPEFATSDGVHVYVNLEDKNSLAVINLQTNQVSAIWNLKPCEEPTGLALDSMHERLFSVCHNQLMIVTDARTGRQVATVPIGAHVDAAAYDPTMKLAFSSNGDSGNVTVVSERTADQFVAVDTVATARGSKTMALDEANHRLFVPALIAGKLQVLVLTPTT